MQSSTTTTSAQPYEPERQTHQMSGFCHQAYSRLANFQQHLSGNVTATTSTTCSSNGSNNSIHVCTGSSTGTTTSFMNSSNPKNDEALTSNQQQQQQQSKIGTTTTQRASVSQLKRELFGGLTSSSCDPFMSFNGHQHPTTTSHDEGNLRIATPRSLGSFLFPSRLEKFGLQPTTTQSPLTPCSSFSSCSSSFLRLHQDDISIEAKLNSCVGVIDNLHRLIAYERKKLKELDERALMATTQWRLEERWEAVYKEWTETILQVSPVRSKERALTNGGSSSTSKYLPPYYLDDDSRSGTPSRRTPPQADSSSLSTCNNSRLALGPVPLTEVPPPRYLYSKTLHVKSQQQHGDSNCPAVEVDGQKESSRDASVNSSSGNARDQPTYQVNAGSTFTRTTTSRNKNDTESSDHVCTQQNTGTKGDGIDRRNRSASGQRTGTPSTRTVVRSGTPSYARPLNRQERPTNGATSLESKPGPPRSGSSASRPVQMQPKRSSSSISRRSATAAAQGANKKTPAVSRADTLLTPEVYTFSVDGAIIAKKKPTVANDRKIGDGSATRNCPPLHDEVPRQQTVEAQQRSHRNTGNSKLRNNSQIQQHDPIPSSRSTMLPGLGELTPPLKASSTESPSTVAQQNHRSYSSPRTGTSLGCFSRPATDGTSGGATARSAIWGLGNSALSSRSEAPQRHQGGNYSTSLDSKRTTYRKEEEEEQEIEEEHTIPPELLLQYEKVVQTFQVTHGSPPRLSRTSSVTSSPGVWTSTSSPERNKDDHKAETSATNSKGEDKNGLQTTPQYTNSENAPSSSSSVVVTSFCSPSQDTSLVTNNPNGNGGPFTTVPLLGGPVSFSSQDDVRCVIILEKLFALSYLLLEYPQQILLFQEREDIELLDVAAVSITQRLRMLKKLIEIEEEQRRELQREYDHVETSSKSQAYLGKENRKPDNDEQDDLDSGSSQQQQQGKKPASSRVVAVLASRRRRFPVDTSATFSNTGTPSASTSEEKKALNNTQEKKEKETNTPTEEKKGKETVRSKEVDQKDQSPEKKESEKENQKLTRTSENPPKEDQEQQQGNRKKASVEAEEKDSTKSADKKKKETESLNSNEEPTTDHYGKESEEKKSDPQEEQQHDPDSDKGKKDTEKDDAVAEQKKEEEEEEKEHKEEKLKPVENHEKEKEQVPVVAKQQEHEQEHGEEKRGMEGQKEEPQPEQEEKTTDAERNKENSTGSGEEEPKEGENSPSGEQKGKGLLLEKEEENTRSIEERTEERESIESAREREEEDGNPKNEVEIQETNGETTTQAKLQQQETKQESETDQKHSECKEASKETREGKREKEKEVILEHQEEDPKPAILRTDPEPRTTSVSSPTSSTSTTLTQIKNREPAGTSDQKLQDLRHRLEDAERRKQESVSRKADLESERIILLDRMQRLAEEKEKQEHLCREYEERARVSERDNALLAQKCEDLQQESEAVNAAKYDAIVQQYKDENQLLKRRLELLQAQEETCRLSVKLAENAVKMAQRRADAEEAKHSNALLRVQELETKVKDGQGSYNQKEHETHRDVNCETASKREISEQQTTSSENDVKNDDEDDDEEEGSDHTSAHAALLKETTEEVDEPMPYFEPPRPTPQSSKK